MVRPVVLLVVIPILFAACTSVGDGAGRSETQDTSVAEGADGVPLPEDARLGDPGPDRASIGGVVFPVPTGWDLYRVAGDGISVKGAIRSAGGDEVLVGSFPIGHEVTDDAFVFFLASELFRVPVVPTEGAIQRFDDGSIYADFPVEPNGSTLQVRAFRDGRTVRFLASLVHDAADTDSRATPILAGARLARDGESVYRVRPGGVSFVETGRSGWLFLDDRNEGVTVAYVDEGVEIIVSLESLTGDSADTGPVGPSGDGGGPAAIPVWIGTDRVIASAMEERDDEWRVEVYEVYLPVSLEISLSGRGVPRGEALLQSPEIERLFREHLWLGGGI